MAHPPTTEQRIEALETLVSIQGNIINDLREQVLELQSNKRPTERA